MKKNHERYTPLLNIFEQHVKTLFGIGGGGGVLEKLMSTFPMI